MSPRPDPGACLGVLLACLAMLWAGAAPAGAATGLGRAVPVSSDVPQIDHLFVIVLENGNAESTFGADPPSPYLGKTLREAGAFIPNYYGVAHRSLPNYIAMISGQPPNLQTQANCPVFTAMLPGRLDRDGIALGQGCVYPAGVRTIADQLEDSGRSWGAYIQDMANSVAAGKAASCRRPRLNSADDATSAGATDQYATRHNPFVYFSSLTESTACERRDVDLARLAADLKSARSTPEYVFVSPDLCADGHDATCADPSSPGGFAGIDAFLREWIPRGSRPLRPTRGAARS